MNNDKPTLTNDVNSMHRILKSDIKKEPNSQEDEIIFGAVVFGVLKNVFETSGVVTTSVGMLVEVKATLLIMKYVAV